MHCLSSVYFFSQPLHVSGISVARQQEVCNNLYVLCFIVDSLLANRQSIKKHNMYKLYIYSIPPDDGLQICLKHVEVDWWNKLRINSASSWFSLHGYYSSSYKSWIQVMFKHYKLARPHCGWLQLGSRPCWVRQWQIITLQTLRVYEGVIEVKKRCLPNS